VPSIFLYPALLVHGFTPKYIHKTKTTNDI
jgi:hypothetical protein